MKKQSQTKKLGDVCAFDKVQGIHRGLPYVGLEHIESHTARFIGAMEPQPVKSSTFRFSEEHVLYGRLRPYLNKALAPDFEGHCSTEIFPLRPSRELSRSYLLFWLLADETCDRINSTCTGARMPRAQMDDVLEFEIPVPPLAEQKRIVGVLDEAFEGLATAKANAGKNLQNAHALFESHLQSVFTQRGNGWVDKRLEEVLDVQPQNGWSPPAANHSDSGTPVLTLSSVTGFVFRPEKLKYTSAKTDPKARYWIRNGDFLITRSNTPELVGHVAIASGIERPTIYPDLIMRMNPDPAQAITEFLYYQMRTPALRREITGRAQGANPTMKKISNAAVRTLPISLPPVNEQRAIVATLNSLAAETQRLAAIYEQKLAALEALKKSLLHQAFAGEL
ncbi:MAG: restriction endonuclease subunit S [Chthoniobacterales bacterium]|nr:restriction endonuclease subunit S [Chthoniobacterales bacterium]